MMTVCKRYLSNGQDAEEAMLSGFLKFFQKIAQFTYQGPGSISAYVRRIMVNECLMLLRSSHATHFPGAAGDLKEQYVSREEDALDQLSAAEILRLITALPTGYRVVFNLYVIEGMPHHEIADLLNIKEGTSKSQLSKARALLQKMIIKMETHGIQS